MKTSGSETQIFKIVSDRTDTGGEASLGCSSVQLDATSSGFSKLTLNYRYTDTIGKPLTLRYGHYQVLK